MVVGPSSMFEGRAMSLTIHADTVPLRVDETGTVRIVQTRVLLDLVVRAFRDGATPEEIVQMYESLSLSNVYAVIAYSLLHREEIDAYLAQRARDAAEARTKVDARQRPLPDIRARLLAARDKKRAS
jgi:uncharacterized protein (DUF433 family)